jgi:hypothetical protein
MGNKFNHGKYALVVGALILFIHWCYSYFNAKGSPFDTLLIYPLGRKPGSAFLWPLVIIYSGLWAVLLYSLVKIWLHNPLRIFIASSGLLAIQIVSTMCNEGAVSVFELFSYPISSSNVLYGRRLLNSLLLLSAIITGVKILFDIQQRTKRNVFGITSFVLCGVIAVGTMMFSIVDGRFLDYLIFLFPFTCSDYPFLKYVHLIAVGGFVVHIMALRSGHKNHREDRQMYREILRQQDGKRE